MEEDSTPASADVQSIPGRCSVENLTNALEHIRLAATLHYVGGAFDPEHMRSIANVAIAALSGEDIPALPDPEAVRARAAVSAQQIQAYIE